MMMSCLSPHVDLALALSKGFEFNPEASLVPIANGIVFQVFKVVSKDRTYEKHI